MFKSPEARCSVLRQVRLRVTSIELRFVPQALWHSFNHLTANWFIIFLSSDSYCFYSTKHIVYNPYSYHILTALHKILKSYTSDTSSIFTLFCYSQLYKFVRQIFAAAIEIWGNANGVFNEGYQG